MGPNVGAMDEVALTTHSVADTRLALESAGDRPVVGWVDLTSPNLVDLIDDLRSGPGGHRLVAVHGRLGAADLDDTPVQRGIATIRDAGLAVHTGDAAVRVHMARRWPGLRFHP